MLRRGTPLFRHHGVMVRRLSMRMFEGCRKQTKEPRRTTPPKLQRTVGHNSLVKTVSKHGRPTPLHADLTERLRGIYLALHDAHARPESSAQVQNAPNDVS